MTDQISDERLDEMLAWLPPLNEGWQSIGMPTEEIRSILTHYRAMRTRESEAVAWLAWITVATDPPKLCFAHPEANGAFAVYTHPTTSAEAVATHPCGYAEVQSYTGAVTLVAPKHMADHPRGICVDVCLALEVTQLWQQGITTTGCCCGHGNDDMSYIGVAETDIPAMKANGYQVRANPMRPGDDDSFVPKTAFSSRPISADEYTPEHAIRRARQIALQSEAAPLCMGEIIKVADMALGETTPMPDWMGASLSQPPATEAGEVVIPTGWYLVPEVPTEEQMAAGLYQSSHDAEYSDVCQSYMDMVRVPVDAPALSQPPAEGVRVSPEILAARDFIADVTARADSLGIGMAKYPTAEIKLLMSALEHQP